MSTRIFFDGGKRPGGGITFGFVVKNDKDEIVHSWGGSKKNSKLTTNDAEYHGLLAALDYAVREKIRTRSILGDSLLVISQMNGKYKVKAKNLKEHHTVANMYVAQFDSITFTWTRRENNSHADAVCRDQRSDKD